MEQLLIKLSVLMLIVIGVIYMAISFIPILVLKDSNKNDENDE
ncbi:hypothetical protein [Thermoanaerobacterium sp. RBIITD]|nr:hypothetical protein [Thermoanaerobacterium sp. RBIITD]SNX53155.1 hypothetical protein SAMN05660242_0654 [Thermoanaerobacterium sp. RBIITD]